MRRRYWGLLASAFVVLSLYAGLYLNDNPPWDPRVLNQGLLTQCNGPWPPLGTPGPNVSQRQQFMVFLANPGTSPKLCAGYSSLIDSQVMLQLHALIVPLNASTGSITILAEPYNLTVPNNNNGISPTGVAYAVFTLHISNDTRGFYVLELPGDCPRLLAVGYAPAQINQSDYGNWVNHSLSCTGNPQTTPNAILALVGEEGLNATLPNVD